jgi:hypothetical protein
MKLKRLTTKYLGLLILLFLTLKINAQRGGNANDHDKPYMWFEHKPEYAKNFTSIKLPYLDDTTRKVQPRSFYLGNFVEMLQYFEDNYKSPKFECLHIYIAQYSDENSTGVPKNCGNLLTLIFAPASEYSSSQPDLDYFIIPPDQSFDSDNGDDFKIDKKLFEEWTKNYIDIMPALRKTYDTTKRENQVNGKPSDTRCITYCSKDLSELVLEQGYIHSRDGKNARLKKSMTATLAAFGDTGHPNTHSGKNRIFLIFDFLDDKGKTIYLEETTGFSGRNPTRGTCRYCVSSSFDKAMKGLDNGQLCPPCQNCPAGYEGCSERKSNK